MKKLNVLVLVLGGVVVLLGVYLVLKRDAVLPSSPVPGEATVPATGIAPPQKVEVVHLTEAIARPVLVEIPSRLQPILDKGVPLQRRLAALRAVAFPLSLSEAQAIYAYLYLSPSEAGLPASGLNALKNDLINLLKVQEMDQVPLVRHLMSLYADSTQDEVLREYAVQHLGTVLKKAGREQARVVGVLQEALNQTHGSLAGTALIAMNNQAALFPGVAEDACRVAGSAAYSAASRTTALQIAAQRADPRALALARALLQEESGDTNLKVSALAVLGRMGEEKDGAILAEYAASSDVRLRGAAEAAMGRRGKRVGSG